MIRFARHAVAVALTAALGVALTAVPAAAYPGKPLTEWSFYVHSNNTMTAYNLGCNQGNFDRTYGISASEVVLDFGVQLSGLSGNELTGTGAFIAKADIEAYAEQFARGYWICTGSDTTSSLYVDLGTNNDNGTYTAAMGTDWANVVGAVNSWISATIGQAFAQGANDIEPGFNANYGKTVAWATAYSAAGKGLYLNFGSADGCPQSSHGNGGCNNGWNQYDLWNVSWNIPAAICAPEIYNTAMAAQWEQIAQYGFSSQGNVSHYIGVWDENDEDTSTLTAQQAWDALLGQLYSNSATAYAPLYSMEIHTA